MNATRLDAIARLLAGRRGAGAATPAARRAKAATDPAFLFVQSFASGSLAPAADGGDRLTLTLQRGLGQTIYFSDRPARIVGAAPTKAFLAVFPFGATNPPNAALVAERATGEPEVVVLELISPAYDETTHTATYEARLLADDESAGFTLPETPRGAAAAGGVFGPAALFIDDCPDLTTCAIPGSVVDPRETVIGPLPGGPAGQCWQWSQLSCEPCRNDQGYYDGLCNNTYPDCDGKCGATSG